MHVIVVDDDEISRKMLVNIIKETNRAEEICEFSNAEEALEYAAKTSVDLAVLDILLPNMNGVELADRLRMLNQDILLIFETCREDYAFDAFQLKAFSYIKKPFVRKDIEYAIESAFLLSKRTRLRAPFFARTFGHFDFFINGQVADFKSAKAKELLALLVDRQGGIVTSEQMIATLWEDRPNDEATQNLASKVTKTLVKELKFMHAEEVVHIGRGSRSINLDKVECDLYQALSGEKDALRQYCGEYMSDYSWGEYRIPILNRLWENDNKTEK